MCPKNFSLRHFSIFHFSKINWIFSVFTLNEQKLSTKKFILLFSKIQKSNIIALCRADAPLAGAGPPGTECDPANRRPLMMPCAPSVRAHAYLYGSAFLAISPLLKRPGLVPFLLLSTCESGEAGLKNCPAGDARLKVKEDERGQPGRLQSSSFSQRSLFARGRGRHYQLLFILFSIFRIAARILSLFSSLTEVQRVAAAISPPACSQINI